MNIPDFMFDCYHTHLTRPIVLNSVQLLDSHECQPGTYVLCLDCGREFPYDWKDEQKRTSDEEVISPEQLEASRCLFD